MRAAVLQTDAATSCFFEKASSLCVLYVQKTNLKMAHSSVHLGECWGLRQDKEVYPNIVNNIANNFSEFLGSHFKPNLYRTMMEYSDYMASNGYCVEDDIAKVMAACHDTLCKEAKLIIYECTRDAMRTT